MRDLQVNAICNLPDLQQLVTKTPTYLLYRVPNRQQHLPKPLQLRKIFGGNHVWTQQICRRRCEGLLPAPRRLRDRDAGHGCEGPRAARVSNSGAPEPRFSGGCAITQAGDGPELCRWFSSILSDPSFPLCNSSRTFTVWCWLSGSFARNAASMREGIPALRDKGPIILSAGSTCALPIKRAPAFWFGNANRGKRAERVIGAQPDRQMGTSAQDAQWCRTEHARSYCASTDCTHGGQLTPPGATWWFARRKRDFSFDE